MDAVLWILSLAMILLAVLLGVAMWQVRGLNKRVGAPRPSGEVTSFANVPAHTHSFTKNSEHEEHGKHVVVKVCWCGEVIRDIG